jgi:hypothetical protein
MTDSQNVLSLLLLQSVSLTYKLIDVLLEGRTLLSFIVGLLRIIMSSEWFRNKRMCIYFQSHKNNPFLEING